MSDVNHFTMMEGKKAHELAMLIKQALA
jgi:hypothetical protein